MWSFLRIRSCVIVVIDSETRQAHEFTHLVKRILEMLYEGPYEDENGKPEAKVLLASPVLVFINAVRIDTVYELSSQAVCRVLFW